VVYVTDDETRGVMASEVVRVCEICVWGCARGGGTRW